MDYLDLKIKTYNKEFKVTMEFIIIGKNGSEYQINTFKVYNRYYYRIQRYNSLFNNWEHITENVAGNCKDDLKQVVTRQIEFLCK